jgi:predicted ATPase
MSDAIPSFPLLRHARLKRLHLTNFLSYRDATLEFGDFVALVGPNASGKSNAVAALKLLREIPLYGLPTAIARRGGFDQLRHRSHGHPYDPGLRIDFQASPGAPDSFYELKLKAVSGKRYAVKFEHAEVRLDSRNQYSLRNEDGAMSSTDVINGGDVQGGFGAHAFREYRPAPGHSAITSAPSPGSLAVAELLSSIQTVEINPARVAELQDPSSTREFEPDGSNTASVYEDLGPPSRQALVDELSAIVPGIDRVEVRRLADKVTLAFLQSAGRSGRREFLAKQMSDGTLRAFGILLALAQSEAATLVVVEEPEIAIHLSAMRTLADILQQQAANTQILITTHSADIVDAIDVDDIKIVWSEDGSSRISPVAEHARGPVRNGLITPGGLLRSDALDPA